MKLKILLLLIVASAICAVRGEPGKRSGGGGGSKNPLGIIKAELIEEDATAAGAEALDMVGTDQAESESTQRIVIKPIRRHRGKRIRIRLVNAKKNKNYVRLKVAGTKNVEQKFPGAEGENDESNAGNADYDSGYDEEGSDTTNGQYSTGQYSSSSSSDGAADEEGTTTQSTDDTETGEDAMKVKHHHHHHHHNHVKTIVKKVPEPYEKIVHVPVEKIVHVPKPYPVEKVVEKVVHVPVEKVVEKIVHIPKPYPVEKIVHVPKIVEKIVYSPLFGKDGKFSAGTGAGSSTSTTFTDLTNDSKLKFGSSGSSLDIIYPNGQTSSYPNNNYNNGGHSHSHHGGPVNSYGKPLGKFPKFPDFEDINSQSNKVHSILDNDAFDFGDLHTSKPNKGSGGGQKKGPGGKNNGNKNKGGRRNKNKKHNNNNKSPFSDNDNDDFFSSASSSSSLSSGGGGHSFGHGANSHSYSGISMPTYTHEFSVSNSDQKEVFFNPSPVPPAAPGAGLGSHHHHQYHHPQHAVHFESLPFQYPPLDETEYAGTASSYSPDFSGFSTSSNWSPSTGDFGQAFNLPAESAQSPIGPVFRPPRKSAPKPFHGGGKKGSNGAPRAGPRRPPRNNQGEAFHRGPSAPKMAGHQLHTNRPHALMGSASNSHSHSSQNGHKKFVHQSRPRPVMAAAATENLETVMLPPATVSSSTTEE